MEPALINSSLSSTIGLLIRKSRILKVNQRRKVGLFSNKYPASNSIWEYILSTAKLSSFATSFPLSLAKWPPCVWLLDLRLKLRLRSSTRSQCYANEKESNADQSVSETCSFQIYGLTIESSLSTRRAYSNRGLEECTLKLMMWMTALHTSPMKINMKSTII